MEASVGHRSLTDRMMGAALMNVGVYEEVEHDTSATSQAAIVVGLVAVASAIGALRGGVGPALASIGLAFVGWLVWAGITYLIGDKVFGGTASWGELLRTLGFAQSPGILYVLGIIPFLGGLVRVIVGIWILVLGVVAVRQALDFGTGKAILTVVVGWLALIVLGFLTAGLLGTGSMLAG